MARIFVSYSRKNTEFCKILTAELLKRDFDFWVDWEGIPPTVDWMKEIEKGIEEADTFLAIVTQEWITSKVCIDELDIAVKNGKRLIPVVPYDIVWDTVPPALAQFNFIFFTEKFDFKAQLDKLFTALDTDYDWLKTHRRLQVKALEWERQQSNSLLLRGDDLQKAEEQLATSGAKDPEPTDLQRQFVLESRRAETRTRNSLVIASGVAVIILTIALIFSIYQMRLSDARRVAAEAQTAVAENDYRLGALLSLASMAINDTDEANQALTRSLFIPAATHGQTFSTDLIHHYIQTNTHTYASWFGDNYFVYASENGDIWIWDKDKNIQIPAQGLQARVSPINTMAGSSNGLLAVGGNSGELVIWDIGTGQAKDIGEDANAGEKINALAWSMDNQLAYALADGTVKIWGELSGHNIVFANEGEKINTVAWSPDGKLAIGTNDGLVIICDILWGTYMELDAKSRVISLAWSTDGELAAGTADKYIVLWDLQQPKSPPRILRGHTDNIFSVAWSNSGQLASGSRDKNIIIWDLKTEKPGRVLTGHTDAVENVSWSRTGSLISSGQDGIVILWDLGNRNLARSWKESIGEVRSVAWSSDGRISFGGEDDTAFVFDPAKDQAILLDVSGGMNSIAWSVDGRLAAGTYENGVLVWGHQKIGGDQYQALPVDSSIQSVAWSSDGRLAAGLFDNKIMLWNTNLEEINPAIETASAVNSVAWSANGHLAAGLDDNNVMTWDLEKDKMQILTGHTSTVTSVAWSADGRLASGSEDGTIIIWNLENSTIGKTLRLMAPVTSVAWSTDGRLASASDDGKITIWDANSETKIKVHNKEFISITSISWSANGGLLSGAVNGETDYYPANVNLAGFECRHLVSNFSKDEWLQYIGDLYPYKPACENLPVPDFGSWQSLDYLKYTTQGRWVAVATILISVAVLWIIILTGNRIIRKWIKRKGGTMNI